MRALLPGNVRSFSGKAKQTQAPLSTLEAPLKHLEANQANQAVNVNVTVTVNGTGIVSVIDYSLLVQSALPGCGRSAQGAPFAQLSLRRVGVLLSRKMHTLAKDFHRCCKNQADVGEEKSRYSAFISRLRPGKRFSGIYAHPKRDPVLKRENFADSRKSSLAGRRSPEILRRFAQDHPVRSGLSRWFLRGAAAPLRKVRDEMMILRK